MISVAPGYILLTAGVGGPAAKWRDRMLSRAILAHQRVQEVGFVPSRSHAELLVGFRGETFAARWRTRKRVNGLCDYIGSHITIGRPAAALKSLAFWQAWEQAQMDRFDGNIYPVHRILMQALGTWVFPWLAKVGAGRYAICSEVVAKFYKALNWPEFAGGWRGWTPAGLERLVRHGDAFEVEFDGLLTQELMVASGLPVFAVDPDEASYGLDAGMV